MLKFDEFNKLVKDFSSIADFLIIYIEEAHAMDGPSETMLLLKITEALRIEKLQHNFFSRRTPYVQWF